MNDVMNRYLATWNAPDSDERDRLLAEHWSPDVRYVDPLADVAGRDAMRSVIGEARRQFPAWVFSPVGDADGHHRQLRFTWGLGPDGDEPVVVGFDVVVLDESGRIHDVRGFLDKAPA